jgi:hypothetical protein
MIRKRPLLVLCAALALLAGAASTTAGAGNPPNADACKKGGWQNLVRADSKGFKNEDACVRYVLEGGTLTTTSRLLCQSYGGSFATGSAPTLWTCNGWINTGAPDYNNKFNALAFACFAHGGNIFAITSLPPAIPGANNSSCGTL